MHALRVGWLLCVLGALAAPCRAQAERPMLLASEASERLFEEGRGHLLHFRLIDAEHAFRRLTRTADGGPAAGYYLALASFLKALVTDERVYFDEFFARSDSLLARLDALPASRWRSFLTGAAHLHRAVAAAKTERSLGAALAGRKAYRHLEDAIEADAAFYEPYAGMGLLHLFIGSLPGAYRTLLKLLGYGGTIAQGLAELGLAAERSRLSREEALVVLAMADIMLNNSAAGGMQTLARLQGAYPHSPLFAYLYGYGLLSNRRAEAAEGFLAAAVHAGTTAPYFYVDYADFFLAQALFRQNRFAEAEGHYRHYLKRHRGLALKAQAYLEMGLTLEMLDRRDEALRFYEQVNDRRAYDSDASAYRAARRLLAAPLTPLERQLLLGRNAYDAGRYARAEAVLQAVFEAPEAPPAIRAEAAYRLGRVYQAQGRLAEALHAHRYAVAHGAAGTQWPPWSQFYIGEIHTQHGDTLQAARSFQAALAYRPPFDYQQALEQRAKAALGRLQQGD